MNWDDLKQRYYHAQQYIYQFCNVLERLINFECFVDCMTLFRFRFWLNSKVFWITKLCFWLLRQTIYKSNKNSFVNSRIFQENSKSILFKALQSKTFYLSENQEPIYLNVIIKTLTVSFLNKIFVVFRTCYRTSCTRSLHILFFVMITFC